MNESVEHLLARSDVGRSGPSLAEDIAEVARRFGKPLPPTLIDLWTASDGLVFDTIDAQILGPMELILLLDEEGWPSVYFSRGYLPLLKMTLSDYLAVAVHEPLAQRVLDVRHDEWPRLLFRDLDALLRSLPELLDQGEFDEEGGYNTADIHFHEAAGDYPLDAPRAAEDRAAARALMSPDRQDFEQALAAQLLDARDLDAWADLLEAEDFVRRTAVERLERMSDPAAREVLRRHRFNIEAFVDAFAEAARAVGLVISDRDGENLQVNGKPMTLIHYFDRRNLPNAYPRIVTEIQDQLAGRDPRVRPDHIMND